MPKGVAGLISDGMELCGYETVPERVVDLVTAAPGAGVATMTPELILTGWGVIALGVATLGTTVQLPTL